MNIKYLKISSAISLLVVGASMCLFSKSNDPDGLIVFCSGITCFCAIKFKNK